MLGKRVCSVVKKPADFLIRRFDRFIRGIHQKKVTLALLEELHILILRLWLLPQLLDKTL
jgi:hypothetical protein